MIRAFSLFSAFALTAGLAFAQDTAAPQPEAPAASEPAQAQTAAPIQMDADAAYESARNQLGILKFCQEQGHNDAKAVEVQERLLTMLPTGDATKGDAAEAKGLEGTVSALGNEQTLEAAAAAQGSTVETLCQQMDAMIQQLAAQLPG